MNRPGIIIILLVMVSGLFYSPCRAENFVPAKETLLAGDTVYLQISADGTVQDAVFEKGDDTQKKKFVSALFAFPFPFGFMGAHRVMLGTSPWVPVVYVATFGGCFGLLPLIDFFVIAFSKDISAYENNPNIFMWVHSKGSSEPDDGGSE